MMRYTGESNSDYLLKWYPIFSQKKASRTPLPLFHRHDTIRFDLISLGPSSFCSGEQRRRTPLWKPGLPAPGGPARAATPACPHAEAYCSGLPLRRTILEKLRRGQRPSPKKPQTPSVILTLLQTTAPRSNSLHRTRLRHSLRY